MFDISSEEETGKECYIRLDSSYFRIRIKGFLKTKYGVAVLVGTSTLCRGVDIENVIVIAVLPAGGVWSLTALVQPRCRVARGSMIMQG